MKSIKRIKIIFAITFLFSILSLIQTQLTSNEISSLQKNLLENQDETTGLFNKSFNSSLKSLKILRTLNTQVKNTSKICRDLSYENGNEIKLEYLELNTLLDCKINFTNLEGFKQENFEKMNFVNLYEALLINISLKENVNWEIVFELLNDYIDVYYFTRNNKDENDQSSSLTLTAKALKMLVYIANLTKNTPEFRGKVLKHVQDTWDNLAKEFQVLKEVKL